MAKQSVEYWQYILFILIIVHKIKLIVRFRGGTVHESLPYGPTFNHYNVFIQPTSEMSAAPASFRSTNV